MSPHPCPHAVALVADETDGLLSVSPGGMGAAQQETSQLQVGAGTNGLTGLKGIKGIKGIKDTYPKVPRYLGTRMDSVAARCFV